MIIISDARVCEKNTPLDKRVRRSISALKTPNSGVKSSLCLWIAWPRLVEKELASQTPACMRSPKTHPRPPIQGVPQAEEHQGKQRKAWRQEVGGGGKSRAAALYLPYLLTACRKETIIYMSLAVRNPTLASLTARQPYLRASTQAATANIAAIISKYVYVICVYVCMYIYIYIHI